jgi:hypothetical protein
MFCITDEHCILESVLYPVLGEAALDLFRLVCAWELGQDSFEGKDSRCYPGAALVLSQRLKRRHESIWSED